jgi:muramoyltetrapeptide carboxypeptidase
MKPTKLKKGDTVGIICPAFSISTHSPRIHVLEDYLHSLGLAVRYGESFGASYGYLAGADELRARDFEGMFSDDGIAGIICMLGGYGATRIIDRIDYRLIAAHPKLFVGFSDITALLNAIYSKAGVPTVHGALGVYLGNPDFDEVSRRDFETLLFTGQKGRVLKNPNDDAETITGGAARGILVGGNLSLVAALEGTPYAVDFTDKVVFLEDVDEKPYRIDRFLSTLRLSGKLDKARAFVFGTFSNCDDAASAWQCRDVIAQYMEDCAKPAIYNFSSGHSFPFINLPIGLEIEFDANAKTLTLLEDLYR